MQSRAAFRAIVLTALLSSTGARALAEFETCTQRPATSRERARCVFEAARGSGSWDRARGELEALGARHPDNPWPRLYLGHVFLYSDPQRAGDAYRAAIGIADRERLAAARVEARVALTRPLSSSGLLDDADAFLAEARDLAERHGDRHLLAKVRIREAYQLIAQGRHLDYAHRLLQQLEKDVFPGGPTDLKKEWLNAMVRVSDVLGRHAHFLAALERSLELAQQAGDLTSIAWGKFAIAVHHVNVELPSPATRDRALALYREALDAARAADHPEIEGLVRLELGKLVGGDDGRRDLETCLAIARRRGDPLLANFCEGALAADLAATRPVEAQGRIEEIMAAAIKSSDPWLMVYGWEERLPVLWKALPPEEALRRSLDVVDSLEALRESQISGAGRAGVLAARAGPYYWLSGRLLENAGDSGARRRDLEQAFQLIERLRARVLLETLEATRTARLPTAAEASDPALAEALDELAEILDRKVEIQRRLLDPRLGAEARAAALAEQMHAERDEAAVRLRIAGIHPPYAALQPRDFATLDALEQDLEEGEALLSFQLAFGEDLYGRFGGGSWLVVSTRVGTRRYRLPDRARLEPRLRKLARLSDPERASAGLARLYGELLGRALDDLPAAVERLVIVPDEGLHRLPFALLRPAADGAPLIARYRLSFVPSATLWLRWRRLDGQDAPPAAAVPGEEATAPVLAFADPLTRGERRSPASGRALAGTRGDEPANGLALAPLPHARAEGRAIVRRLGGGSRLLAGADASESFLKSADLQRFGILHFAAHAIIDGEVPERSAVFLAPGSAEEDGWLQPGEIAELELDGRLVVLASCDTAAGQVLRGEGVMSLARSFFYAGAPAVVASLWPLPDRESAVLFKGLYRRLAGGASLDAALVETQRSMIRAGAPARAWAGVVILGDGAATPFPGGLGKPATPTIVLGGLLLLLAVAWLLRRRRSRPPFRDNPRGPS